MTTKPPKNGLHTIYHKNDQKSEEGKYKDGKKEGKWTSWDSKGEISAEGKYKAGKKYGKWIDYSRITTDKGKYKNDKKDGKWIEYWFGEKRMEKYYSNGDLIREIYFYNDEQKKYDNNIVDQYFADWYENGQKNSEGCFINKRRESQWSFWYENGQLQSQGCYKDGIEDGKWTYWYDDGQKSSEGCYKDKRREGQWTYWHENGQKSAKGNFKTRQYHYGTIHGEGTKKDGRPNMVVWVGEKEEQKDGKWTYWHANGLKAAEGYYGGDRAMSGGNLSKHISGDWPYGDAHSAVLSTNRNRPFGNQKTGKWTYWHPNGIKAREEKWVFIHQGRKNFHNESRNIELEQRVGWVSSWYPNGQLALKGFYTEDGYKVGEWKRWFVDGRIKSICDYHEPLGKDNYDPLVNIASVELWDDSGRKLNVFFDESKRKDRWTISSLNDEILHELKYPNKVFKEEGDDISENERKDFDYYWSRTAYNFKNPTIEEAILQHFDEDVNYHYVEFDSALSVIAKREEEKRRQRYSGISSSRSSVDEDGFSWLDKQALTDDEKLLGESFWRGIL